MKEINFLKSNLIAHRGLYSPNVPENTIVAFTKAMNKNYTIELDIHILIDNTIVVMHDYNLFRMTNKNKIVESLSYAQLSNIKIKNKYTIPTLRQVMHIVNGRVPLLIEIKNLSDDNRFELELVKILDNYNGKFAIQTINPLVIDWFYKNRKNYVIGLIIVNNLNYKLIKKYIKKVDFVSVNKKMLPLKLKIKNKLILGWTINTTIEKNKYEIFCDNLICEKIL